MGGLLPAADGVVILGAAAVDGVEEEEEEEAFREAAEAQAEGERVRVGDMKASEFLNRLEHDAIVKEIGEVESRMCGEIRVFVSRKEVKDAVAVAQKTFHHLGMEKTTERNGVLIYVAPRVRKFAVIGDRAIHEKCGDKFWKEVAYEMSLYFGRGEFTEGIIHGIRRAGKLMAEHFPRRSGGRNEQPDEIAHD